MNRKKLYLFIFLFIILVPLMYYVKTRVYDPEIKEYEWSDRIDSFISQGTIKEGDIVFQVTTSKQSKAIQLATHSEWNHVGVVLKDLGEYFVYEAVQPVKKTPIAEWFARSEADRFAIKRLKESEKFLNTQTLDLMKITATKYLNKNYDIYFEWSDERLYCSEFVWKIYKEALGIEVGKTQQLKDCDLSSDEVKKVMNERYGDKPPLEETVISPAAIFESDLLKTVMISK